MCRNVRISNNTVLIGIDIGIGIGIGIGIRIRLVEEKVDGSNCYQQCSYCCFAWYNGCDQHR